MSGKKRTHAVRGVPTRVPISAPRTRALPRCLQPLHPRRGGGLPESQSDCGTPERPMRAQAFPTSLEFSYPVEAAFAVLTPYPPAPSSATLPPSLMVSAFSPQQLRTTNPLEAVKSDQPGWDLGFNSGSGYTCCASIQFVPDLAAGRNSALASVCSCRSWASF
nr:uncharacterized protein LOC119627280 [Chlorocebus sabaeus]